MKIVAYDPGKATGVARWADGSHESEQYSIEDFYGRVDNDLQWADLVVCESFIITPATARKTQAPWSLEHIGVLKRECYIRQKELVMQQPSQAKRVATDARLRKMDWWHRSDHARDASRHMLYFLIASGKVDVDRIL